MKDTEDSKITTMAAADFAKATVRRILKILRDYKSIEVTHYGDVEFVIHKPDAPVVGMESDDAL